MKESAERQHHQCRNAPARHSTAPAEPAVSDEIQNSANAYQQAQASLQDFYVPDYSQTEQVAELQARIDELEMQNAMAQQQTQQPDEMELLERSYQLAAQYMGNGNGNYQAPPQPDEKGKRSVQPVQNIGSKRFGMQFLLKSIYTDNGLLYFHTELKNTSNIAFDIDYVSFKIVDKKVIKRTAMQEQVLEPLRAQNYVTVVHGKSSERTVFALEKFTIPDDKQLVIEVAEKEGGRHQSFVVDNEDIVRANVIDELSIQ